MIRDAYTTVMDPERNPLVVLPKIVTFQLMTVLAWMWSAVFSLWVGSMAVFGPSVGVHMILLVGVMITAETFAQGGASGGIPSRVC